jgi:hypothetical protein
VNVSISIRDTATPNLRKFIGGLTGPARSGLLRAMGTEVQHVTTEHVRALAGARHTTASRLGAAPSNFLAQAAEKIAAPEALTADQTEAVLTINHPGFSRAFRDVTIRPRNAKSLAIPLAAIAYNRRPRQLWDRLKLFIPKGKRVIAMSDGAGGITAIYALVRSVTQSQDRSLLPSAEQWETAAAKGAKQYLQYALGKGGRL